MANNRKIVTSEFSMYGLNRYRNFLAAPDCDCGQADEKPLLVAKDDKTLWTKTL